MVQVTGTTWWQFHEQGENESDDEVRARSSKCQQWQSCSVGHSNGCNEPNTCSCREAIHFVLAHKDEARANEADPVTI